MEGFGAKGHGDVDSLALGRAELRRRTLLGGLVGGSLLSLGPSLTAIDPAHAAVSWFHPFTERGHISSDFGPRTPPPGGGSSDHKGIDYTIPGAGSSIYAVAAGTVQFAGNGTGGFGTYVKISHSDGYESFYAHLVRDSAAVSKNQYVAAGTYLGDMGETGVANGVHLHLEIRRYGLPVDPEPLVHNKPLASGTGGDMPTYLFPTRTVALPAINSFSDPEIIPPENWTMVPHSNTVTETNLASLLPSATVFSIEFAGLFAGATPGDAIAARFALWSKSTADPLVGLSGRPISIHTDQHQGKMRVVVSGTSKLVQASSRLVFQISQSAGSNIQLMSNSFTITAW